jgi:hypothetical protein
MNPRQRVACRGPPRRLGLGQSGSGHQRLGSDLGDHVPIVQLVRFQVRMKIAMATTFSRTTDTDATDLIRVPVYLLNNDSPSTYLPGATCATDLVLALPRSRAWAAGTLEILHRIDGPTESPDREIVEITLELDHPLDSTARLVIDSPPEELGTTLMTWLRSTNDHTSPGGSNRADIPSRDPSRLVPLAFDVHSLRRAVLDERDLNLAVDVLILEPDGLVPIELQVDEHGNGWDEQRRFRFSSSREL